MAESKPTGSKFPLRLAIIAVAAVAVVVVLLVLSVVTPNASAAKDLRAALRTTRDYKGWVHVRVTPPQLQVNLPAGVVAPTTAGAQPRGTAGDLNTADGTWVRARDVRGAQQIEMYEPASRTSSVYDAASNELRISQGSGATPGTFADEIAASPVSVADLLDRYDSPSKAPPSTDASHDADLTRYDLVGRGDEHAFKGSVWVDVATKLIRRARWDTPDGPVEVTYTYGPPEIPDIYAAGVPRDAKTIHNAARH